MWSASDFLAFFFFRGFGGKNWNARLLSYTLLKRVRSLAVSSRNRECVRRVAAAVVIFFRFYKEERSTEYLLLCWNTERQSLNNATSPQPITQSWLKSLRRKSTDLWSCFYIYAYIFFNVYERSNYIIVLLSHFQLIEQCFLPYFCNMRQLVHVQQKHIVCNLTYFCILNWQRNERFAKLIG